MRTILLAVGLVLGGGILFCAGNGLAEPAPGSQAQLPDFGDLLQKQRGLTPAQFHARYVPRPTAPDALAIDLALVQYLDLIQKRIKPSTEQQPLSDAQRRALSAQGLVVMENRAFPSFGDAFYDVFVNDQPLFVTSDAMLHAFHKSFDQLLQDLEEQYLTPLLAALLRDGAAGVRDIRSALGRDAVVAQATDDIEMFFEVGRELLKGNQGHSNPRIDEILKAAARETPLHIRFLGRARAVDFSQFRPRGHYTRSEGLKRYFRAMMWLGREDLAFRIGESFRETVAAFLMVDAIQRGGVYREWEDFNRTISYLVGSPDGANPRDLLALLARLGYRDFEDFVRRATPADTLARIGDQNIGEQKILSAIAIKAPGDPQFRLPKSAQLLGQRFTLDSYLFHQLTFDRIPREVNRMMPQPLDVPAALGQPRAIELLQSDLDRYRHQESLAACIEYVKALPDEFWKENVYHGWLDVLRELGAEPSARAPSLVKTRAWADLKLQTQLASWAQLRHDTILYAKQSYSVGLSCDYCDVYVEPNPSFFARLGAIAERTASLLKGAPRSSDAAKQVLDSYTTVFDGFTASMGQLRSVAEKELAGTPITAQERLFLRSVMEIKVTTRGCAPDIQLSGWYPKLFPVYRMSIEWDPTIADVHTQPTDEMANPVGKVLHVGVGNVNLAAFLVKGHDGKTRAYLGPVFSYYEVIEGNYNRLTDEMWKEKLGHPGLRLGLGAWAKPGKGPAPQRPEWMSSLLGR